MATVTGHSTIDMDTAIGLRTQVRRRFTITQKELKALLDDETTNDDVIRAKWLSFDEKADRLSKLDNEIQNSLSELLSKGSDKGEIEIKLNNEFDLVEEYREQYYELKTRYDSRKLLCNKSDSDEENDGASVKTGKSCISAISKGDVRSKYRLPKLELVKFDGQVKNWIAFWGMFQSIHEDPNIDNGDKFRFLLQHTVEGTPARDLVMSYPPSGDNYLLAIDQLKARFARDELLIEVYVRELLQLVLKQSQNEKALNLSSLYDKLVTQLRALEALGVTQDKYASILYPLVESAIPAETLIAWERHRTNITMTMLNHDKSKLLIESDDNLTMLLAFLKVEVESKERLALAHSSFDSQFNNRNSVGKLARTKIHLPQESVPTASSLLATESQFKKSCLFCNKTHDTLVCTSVVDWSLEKKREQLKRTGGCFVCLKRGHNSQKCKGFVKCLLCQKRHVILMCPQLGDSAKRVAEGITTGTTQKSECSKGSTSSNEMLATRASPTFLQTLVVRVGVGRSSQMVRAVLDPGAQNSYIKSELLERIKPSKVGREIINHSLFGGIETKQVPHNIYNLTVQERWGDFKCNLLVRDQEKICTYLPRLTDEKYLKLLKEKGIILSDSGIEDLEVKLLLGADVWADIITGQMEKLHEGLIAIKTTLGWVLTGQTHNDCLPSTTTTLLSGSTFGQGIDYLWRLDILGIEDPTTVMSRREMEEAATQHFNRTMKIGADHRYVVSLPWIEGHDKLINNKNNAEKRLHSTTKRLLHIQKIDEYNQIFLDWEALGIIERIPTDDKENSFYLPHHPIIKSSSHTTKLRPVFDASSKDVRGRSLNDCVEIGENLITLIPPLLMRFRLHKIGVSSDIEKAFLQINVTKEDRDVLRFLWWEDTRTRKKMFVYRHCRLVFGLGPSPFLLAAVLKHHLENVPDKFVRTARLLLSSWYVDNSILSLRNEMELNEFKHEAQEIMEMAGFNLREWTFSGMEAGERNVVSVLGMNWEFTSDLLSCNVKALLEQIVPLTKRGLLSAAQRLFDPIGHLSPVSLIPKLLLQETWKQKIKWDEELPVDIVKRFSLWLQQIHLLKNCSIPRRYCEGLIEESSCSLHIFSDASKFAYAACAFLRVENKYGVYVSLIQAKSRIAPLKATTIPRLELLGALIASRLCKEIRETLNIPLKEYLWCDSSVVVTWIQRQDDWTIFVANRCKEIRRNTDIAHWRHIAGRDNTDDLPSRGCSARVFVLNQWWKGPSWLKLSENKWPFSEFKVSIDIVNAERKKTVIAAVACENYSILNRLNRFSKYSMALRVVAWALRFSRSNETLDINEEKIEFDIKVPLDLGSPYLNDSSNPIVIENDRPRRVIRLKKLSGAAKI